MTLSDPHESPAAAPSGRPGSFDSGGRDAPPSPASEDGKSCSSESAVLGAVYMKAIAWQLMADGESAIREKLQYLEDEPLIIDQAISAFFDHFDSDDQREDSLAEILGDFVFHGYLACAVEKGDIPSIDHAISVFLEKGA